MAITKLVGSSVRRREDRRLLRGAGRFVADISLPDMLHMAIVRSSRPHAILKSIDRSVAVAQDGVVLVLDGAEIAAGVHPCPPSTCFPNPSQRSCGRSLSIGSVMSASHLPSWLRQIWRWLDLRRRPSRWSMRICRLFWIWKRRSKTQPCFTLSMEPTSRMSAARRSGMST
jgi:hypothetical protein